METTILLKQFHLDPNCFSMLFERRNQHSNSAAPCVAGAISIAPAYYGPDLRQLSSQRNLLAVLRCHDPVTTQKRCNSHLGGRSRALHPVRALQGPNASVRQALFSVF
jgi:hypothetical protein